MVYTNIDAKQTFINPFVQAAYISAICWLASSWRQDKKNK